MDSPLSRLSPAVLGAIGVLIMAGVGGGGYYAYRTYDFVQHDNDFCMSCHLMAEPFERFAESAHQGLGCKACHQPTIVARSQMAFTQIVENPGEMSVHAEVPNEVCEECHIVGDADHWRMIANTAGHRVHLESDEPELQGLQCVECHSTSLHEFAPIDRTCAQSECHAANIIQLGGMSDLTIHCAACHTFVAPIADHESLLGNAVQTVLLPDFDECFACHVMRTLAEMPSPDPHDGSCAACHNPHEQTESSQAVQSCATAGCHSEVDTLTPFHRGIPTETLSNCLNCHRAHDFSLDGSDCASCHEGAEAPVEAITALLDFSHGQHGSVECGNCHTNGDEHGAPTVATAENCRACHHTVPVSNSCSRCHTPSDAPSESYGVVRAMTLAVGTDDPSRTFTFPHTSHSGLDCASCHSQGLALEPPPDLDCQSCHEDHHEPERDCASCHRAPPEGAHPPSEAHVTCTGAGCHEAVPFEGVPRTRQACLACHQDQRDHRPEQRCADCHTLPAPRGGSGD